MELEPRVRKLAEPAAPAEPRAGRLSGAALEEHAARGRRFDFVRRRLSNVDVEEVWGKLEDELTIGAARGNTERILRALDGAEGNLRRAAMICQVAVEELAEFEIDYRAAYGVWEWRAREALEARKRDKKVSGQITTAVVDNWVAAEVPQYRLWEASKRDIERNRNVAETMKKAWESRLATLRKMADLVERRRGVESDMLPRRDNTKGDRDERVE